MAKAKSGKFDLTLFIIIAIMLVLGLVILYSASTVVSFSKAGNSYYYFFHQLLYGAIPGLVLMFILARIDYHVWQKYAPLIIAISIIGLFAVLLPHVGYRVGNSKRWIAIGSVSLQISEFAKLAMIFFIASWLDKRGKYLHDFYTGLFPLLSVVAIVCALVFLEPDIGTMLIFLAVTYSMLLVGGSRLKHLGTISLVGILFLIVIVKLEPYRIQRFVTFFNTQADPTGIGYQINQALLAIGSGGVFGYGYGGSRQKYNFLPEVMGDSIFAVTAEELGFVRSAMLIGIYFLFAMRGLKIAKYAPDNFGKMVATGIVAWIVLQALLNIGAIMGVLPLTGVPLPLVSYGSSSVIATLAAMGILLNISKRSAV